MKVVRKGNRPAGWTRLMHLLDPDGSAYSLIKSKEDEYAARRSSADAAPHPNPERPPS